MSHKTVRRNVINLTPFPKTPLTRDCLAFQWIYILILECYYTCLYDSAFGPRLSIRSKIHFFYHRLSQRSSHRRILYFPISYSYHIHIVIANTGFTAASRFFVSAMIRYENVSPIGHLNLFILSIWGRNKNSDFWPSHLWRLSDSSKNFYDKNFLSKELSDLVGLNLQSVVEELGRFVVLPTRFLPPECDM